MIRCVAIQKLLHFRNNAQAKVTSHQDDKNPPQNQTLPLLGLPWPLSLTPQASSKTTHQPSN